MKKTNFQLPGCLQSTQLRNSRYKTKKSRRNEGKWREFEVTARQCKEGALRTASPERRAQGDRDLERLKVRCSLS